ncbi:MAG: hypothetical protein AAB466_09375 [Verrucomicrobiota bacterium]
MRGSSARNPNVEVRKNDETRRSKVIQPRASSFGIHPPEFASIVPPGSWIRGATLPEPTHPASIEILRATIDDILRAYPGLDWIWLWLHAHTLHVGRPQPSGEFRERREKDAPFLQASSGEDATFTGVWFEGSRADGRNVFGVSVLRRKGDARRVRVRRTVHP